VLALLLDEVVVVVLLGLVWLIGGVVHIREFPLQGFDPARRIWLHGRRRSPRGHPRPG
jgi:hypothetical protein